MFQIKEIAISDIKVSNRARVDIGDLKELKESIKKSGQLNPILITENFDLIAGERRLRALQELEKETAICRIMPNVSQSDLFMIELMENVARKDFTWYEELELKKKLHYHWVEQAEKKKQKHGYRETAKKLNCALGGISTDLVLADALEVFPELKDCETKTQAKTLYRKIGDQAQAIQSQENLTKEEKERMKELYSGNFNFPKAKHSDEEPSLEEDPTVGSHDEQREADFSNLSVPEPVYAIEKFETFVDKIPNNSVGFIELDPPYAIDYETNYAAQGKKKATANDWTVEELYNFYSTMLPILYQKLLPNSWVLCWTGVEHWMETNRYAKEAGFITQSRPGIWIKPGGSCNKPSYVMISNYEMFLLFRKEKATFNTNSFLSTIQSDTTNANKKIHQWEKPIKLYDQFFTSLARPGAIFLSPFAGSGNSLISAAKFNMYPMGCDLKQKYAINFYNRFKEYFMEI